MTIHVCPCFALGILEALWHVTSTHTPDGAIGKLSNQDIADEMFYDGDADELIQALITVKLIDESPQHRLVIHDWSNHADQSTKRKLSRHGKSFVAMPSNCPVVTSHDSSELASSIQSQYPEPVSSIQYPDKNPPKPPQGGNHNSESNGKSKPPIEVIERFELFWKAYPGDQSRKGCKADALNRFAALPECDQMELPAAAKRYGESLRRSETFATHAVRFIVKGHGKNKVEPWREWVKVEEPAKAERYCPG